MIISPSSESDTSFSSLKAADKLYIVSECIVGLIIIFNNGFVLLLFCRYRRLRTLGNYFICSLAFADFTVGVFLPPLIVLAQLKLPRNFELCLLTNSLIGIFANASILSTLNLTVDRLRHIRDANRVLTTKYVFLAVLGAWIVAISFGMLPLLGYNQGSAGFKDCGYREVIPLGFNVYVQLFGFLIPILLLMIVVHADVYFIYHRSNMIMTGEAVSDAFISMLRRERRLLISLALISLLFAVCWLPLQSINAHRLFTGSFPDSSWVLVTVVLTHVNSAINPIIYSVSQMDFRHVMVVVLPNYFVGGNPSNPERAVQSPKRRTEITGLAL